MAIVNGTAQGVDDSVLGAGNLEGTFSGDIIKGFSGDDVLLGKFGNDTLIGGKGSDVLTGGLGLDVFDFSAGHIQDGATDYITDFNIIFDRLKFRDSGNGQKFEIVDLDIEKLSIQEFNGVDLGNSVDRFDVIFTVRNSVTLAEQDIVLLDFFVNPIAALDVLDLFDL
jgi:Ca2+-binding RTX toxin-like protein